MKGGRQQQGAIIMRHFTSSLVLWPFFLLACGGSVDPQKAPGGGTTGGDGSGGKPPISIDLAQVPTSSYDASKDGFVVHEWGTLTSVSGSDGVIVTGLHHEEEDLP